MTPQGLVAALDLQVPIFGLGNTCMDGFLIFLAQMIPYEYDRLLEYADLKYLHVCANSGTLTRSLSICEAAFGTNYRDLGLIS